MDSHQPRLSGFQRMDSATHEVHQILEASDKNGTLTERLMEKICDPLNLNRAYKRVKANKGRAGVDGMTVLDLQEWIATQRNSY